MNLNIDFDRYKVVAAGVPTHINVDLPILT
jgi:hypothetical protein